MSIAEPSVSAVAVPSQTRNRSTRRILITALGATALAGVALVGFAAQQQSNVATTSSLWSSDANADGSPVELYEWKGLAQQSVEDSLDHAEAIGLTPKVKKYEWTGAALDSLHKSLASNPYNGKTEKYEWQGKTQSTLKQVMDDYDQAYPDQKPHWAKLAQTALAHELVHSNPIQNVESYEWTGKALAALKKDLASNTMKDPEQYEWAKRAETALQKELAQAAAKYAP